MAKKAVLCIAKSEEQAADIVNRLRTVGFIGDDISALLPDRAGTHDFAHEQHTKAPEGAATGAVAGGTVVGAVAWLIGMGALAVPGVGPLIAAGPILAALSGAAAGGALGLVAGALVGMGIPEYEAKQYENKIKGGNILISVHTETSEERKAAKEVFEYAHAADISSASEAAA